MARNSIRILQTVRLRSVEAARQALGACLTAEAQAAEAIQAIAEAARKDRAAHQTVEGSHWFLEMFARRLRVSEQERLAAEAAFIAAQAATAEARAAVMAARTAAEAVETLVTERAAADQLDVSRREQHALDDMARTRFNSADRCAARDTR